MSHSVGLVGCGRWGPHVLRDLVGLGCDVTVVVRSPTGRRHALASGSAVVASVEDLPAVDGVVVVTPTTTHADVLAQVLDLGVPVFVEKPLTDDPDSALELAARAPGRLFVMHKWRYTRWVGWELARPHGLAGGEARAGA